MLNILTTKHITWCWFFVFVSRFCRSLDLTWFKISAGQYVAMEGLWWG